MHLDYLESPNSVDSPIETLLSAKNAETKPVVVEETNYQPTLADIKRRARQEADEARDDGHIKRFQTLQFTSENSRQLDEADLRTFYCGICGAHCLILEGNFDGLPVFESTRVLKIDAMFHKLYMISSDIMLIKRPEGVESRIMLQCRDCHFPLAYRVKSGKADELTQYLYIFQDSIVSKQKFAEAFILTTIDTKNSMGSSL